MQSLRICLTAGVGALLIGSPVLAQAPPPPNQAVPPVPDGMAIQASGPIHEAFAQPALQTPVPGAVVAKQPPNPVNEIPAAQRPEGDNVVWIPGYWSWDTDRNDFIWVSGVWRRVPPGRRWVPGYWAPVDNGFQRVPGFWAPDDQQTIEYQQAPPTSLDNGPSAPAPVENAAYVPGIWMNQANQYAWRPGYWLNPQDNWNWNPAQYIGTPNGSVFVNGYWDYPLDNRGLMFAPVAYNQPLYNQAGYSYQPNYAVNVAGLLSSLFVRPGWGYYYGNYYGNPYLNAGYQPWYSWGPRYYDPLFGYYRWNNRNNPGWLNGLQNTYQARVGGTAPLPGRTLTQQNALLANNAANRSLQTVMPLSQVARSGARLTTLTNQQIQQHRTAANQFHELAKQRVTTERRGPIGNTTGVVHGSLALPARTGPRLPVHVSGPTGVTTRKPPVVNRGPATTVIHRPVPRTVTPHPAVHTAPRSNFAAPRYRAPAAHGAPVSHAAPAHAAPAHAAPAHGGRRR